MPRYSNQKQTFWRANKVAGEEKTDQPFLLFVGRDAFEKLTTLCAPKEPEGKPLEELLNLLRVFSSSATLFALQKGSHAQRSYQSLLLR